MKISDELRTYAEWWRNSIYTKSSAEKLRAIADRIDNEMAELPRSAEGRVWTGSEGCFCEREGTEFRRHRPCGLVRKDGKWFLETASGWRYEPESMWYERPDSLERIAEEIEESDDDGCTDRAERNRRLSKEGGHE